MVGVAQLVEPRDLLSIVVIPVGFTDWRDRELSGFVHWLRRVRVPSSTPFFLSWFLVLFEVRTHDDRDLFLLEPVLTGDPCL